MATPLSHHRCDAQYQHNYPIQLVDKVLQLHQRWMPEFMADREEGSNIRSIIYWGVVRQKIQITIIPLIYKLLRKMASLWALPKYHFKGLNFRHRIKRLAPYDCCRGPCELHHVSVIELSMRNRMDFNDLINQGWPDLHLRTSSRLCDRSIHLSRSRTATYLSPLISTEIDSVFVTNLTSLLTDGHPIEVDVWWVIIFSFLV